MVSDPISNLPSKKQWQKVGFRPHHGIVLPLFSLHSKKSSGIGEFLDLIPLIDWLKGTKFDVIQLLPLNDTGGLPSPYSALTANGLNPIHLSLHDLPLKNLHPPYPIFPPGWQKEIIDYEKVAKLKTQFLKEYFDKCFPSLSNSPEYLKFTQNHSSWLESYALYRAAREHLGVFEREKWLLIKKNKNNLQKEMDFFSFLQFLSFKQLKQVKEYAEENQIFLKGDIPILLSSDSADVLENEDLFIKGKVAGAPPDQFSEEGQYWGFPVYDWEHKFEKVLDFWKKRLKIASEFYHIYRLDHLVGLFRIWAINKGDPATKGVFLPSDESLWIPTGTKILSEFLKASPLFPIAEDLGVVPDSVRAALLNLGIPGTKVLRWEREGLHGKFHPLNSFSKISMTTVSTHDTETLKGWAIAHPHDFKRYCHDEHLDLSESSENLLFQILEASHKSSSLFHINLLQEYLSFVPHLSKKDPSKERINNPADFSYPNWCYRFKPSVEEISSDKDLLAIMNAVSK
ncbi:4-alpha-glucanotransferase [Criblamydia sequanensis]|uniref:4-alpha-glucanotransferase n=1 Tax=Candidatus Criblamydia sequanensis CRIB-18 TaxID=1437425 RepID=A0A090D0T0_9BACT|nr:4-alpha-glucanotransferase [Criblamydia sequanensis]CDR34946.1 4-alpha-glucanotransferase [Criblamydia sequanensis CRIB-18]